MANQLPPGNSVGSNVENVNVVEPADKFTVLAVRGAILGTGLLGLAIYVRNSRVFAKFRHVNRIPQEYFKKEVHLKGIVREVTPYGLLKVEHQPVISIAKLLGRKPKKNVGLLNLRLAGMDLSPEGLNYLAKDLKLANRPIGFEVIKPTTGNSDCADAVITIKKNFFIHSNLNVDLVRKGLARVLGPEDEAHIEALRSNSVYSRYISGLLTCEKVADRRGVGLWERSTWVESIQSLPTSFGQIVKTAAVTKLVLLCFQILRDLVFIALSALKHGYYLGTSVVSYTGSAYKIFAQKVDRLSNFYLVQKNRLLKLKSGKSAAVTGSEKK